jgi:hypothetical protein
VARLRKTVVALLGAACGLSLLSTADAAVSTFFEEFDGGFSQAWDVSPGALPSESLVPFRPNVVSYAGGQGVTFTAVDGVGVARLGIQNAPSWTRLGYLSRVSLADTVGEAEARISTLAQGGSTIDGLFDLWLVNSQDHTRFVRVGMFGDRADTLRSWTYSSSLAPYSTAGPGLLPPLAYLNNYIHAWAAQ